MCGVNSSVNILHRADDILWNRAGYHHMHVILHYDPSIPAIFSEAADEDLIALQDRSAQDDRQWLNVHALKPSQLWVRIVAQIVAAFQYICEISPVAHLDIKPENVLVKYPPSYRNKAEPVELRCMLSDYGQCLPKKQNLSQVSDAYPRMLSTARYNPPERDFHLWNDINCSATALHLSAYQCMSTAVQLARFGDGFPGQLLHFVPSGFVPSAHHPTIADAVRYSYSMCTSREDGPWSTLDEHMRISDDPPDQDFRSNKYASKRALHAILSGLNVGEYTPDQLMRYMDYFVQNIYDAAHCPHGWGDVRIRCGGAVRKRDAAASQHRLALALESEHPEYWRRDRPPPPP
jgi:serine/threonine protein kinase